jgi:hypothetical protein
MASSIAGFIVIECRHVKTVGCLFVRQTGNQANISLLPPGAEIRMRPPKFGRNLYRFLWTATTKTIKIAFLKI